MKNMTNKGGLRVVSDDKGKCFYLRKCYQRLLVILIRMACGLLPTPLIESIPIPARYLCMLPQESPEQHAMYSFVTKGMSTFMSELKGHVLEDGSADDGGKLFNEVMILKPPRAVNLAERNFSRQDIAR